MASENLDSSSAPAPKSQCNLQKFIAPFWVHLPSSSDKVGAFSRSGVPSDTPSTAAPRTPKHHANPIQLCIFLLAATPTEPEFTHQSTCWTSSFFMVKP